MFALSIGLFLSNGIGLVALLLFQKSDVWAILIPLLQLLSFIVYLLWNRYADVVLKKRGMRTAFLLLHLAAFVCFWGRLAPYAIIDSFSITAAVYLILSIVFRFAAQKCQPNDMFGIRIPATLDFPEVWKQTHQKLSEIITVFLPAQFLCIFFLASWGRMWAAFVLLILPLLMGCIYGWAFAGPYYARQEEERIAQERLEECPFTTPPPRLRRSTSPASSAELHHKEGLQ